MRCISYLFKRTAGFYLILLLQIAACFVPSSEAAAQQILTNNVTGGDGYRYYYTYYLSGGKEVYHGIYEEWQNTTLIWRQNYRNGVRHGTTTTFFSDGDTATLVNYVDGLLEGEAESWYLNGRLAEVKTYVGNVLNGPYQDWNYKGLNKESGDYVDGIRFMTESWAWYTLGQMYQHQEVFGNFMTITEWYEDGKMMRYAEYMDGR